MTGLVQTPLEDISKISPQPNYQVSKTIMHIFVYILTPHKNGKSLPSMLYYTIFLVDYALY